MGHCLPGHEVEHEIQIDEHASHREIIMESLVNWASHMDTQDYAEELITALSSLFKTIEFIEKEGTYCDNDIMGSMIYRLRELHECAGIKEDVVDQVGL